MSETRERKLKVNVLEEFGEKARHIPANHGFTVIYGESVVTETELLTWLKASLHSFDKAQLAVKINRELLKRMMVGEVETDE